MIRASSKAKSHFMDGRARLWVRAKSKRCSERGKADANGKLSWFEAIERIESQSQEESCARNQSRRSSRGDYSTNSLCPTRVQERNDARGAPAYALLRCSK